MPLSTEDTEADILAQLRLVTPRVYVTEVPDDVVPVYPLVVVYFGEPIRTAKGQGIVSTRQDTLRGYCLIEVQAPTDAAANAVKNKIRNLAGHRPFNCGEMRLEGGGGAGYSRASSSTKPTLYYRGIAFSWLTNLAWND